MGLVSLGFRFLLLIAVFVLPPGAAGWGLLSWRGAIAGAALGLLALVLLALLAEHGVMRALRASPLISPAFRRTVDRALRSRDPMSQPRVFSFPETGPRMIYLRAPFGDGAILLSQGLISLLDEDEIRAVIQEAAIRVRARGAAFRTFSLWSAILLSRAGSRAWSGAVFLGTAGQTELSPLSALRFAMAYPWIRFFLALGSGRLRVRRRGTDSPDACAGALRKLELDRRIYGAVPSAAATFAGLVNLSLEG